MLQDLQKLGAQLQHKYLSTYQGKDKQLPLAFKQMVNEIDGSSIVYNDYSFVVTVNLSAQKIFFPNQLWYIAACFADYYKALSEYTRIVKVDLHLTDTEIKQAKDNQDFAETLLANTTLSDEEKSLIAKFLSDYAWWYGGKGIERADFHVSPILALCKLVNASQGYVADLCKFLAKNDKALQLLKNEISDSGTIKTLSKPLQQIFYGAPGTGKSCGIKKIIKEHNIDEKTQVIRTTFHPDSDYSTFVGAYKPTMDNGQIIYSFTKQAFLKAYIAAWKQDKPIFLVIEEINRGNCAQIFGDIFQLLDRNDNGESEYPIQADQDIRECLAKEFADVEGLEDDIQSGKVLVLPANLYIWATMNTSDQSLFPIDSAFKRRWDWEYVPIKYANGNWVIEIGECRYSWVSFQKIVNKKVYEINHSEDKMLGDFFVKANDQDVISEKVLINKILFYLWNDVCKDGEGDIFKKDEKTDLTFSDLYGSNGTTNLIAMMEYLGVEQIEDDDMDENDDTNSDTLGGKGKYPKYSIDGSTKVYSTPKSVLKIINDFAQKNLNMSVPDMIKTWNRIANRNDFLIESWEPSPTDNSNPKRRTAIKWNGKSVWVNRGWTEELFQTFIENVKKELGIDIVKVN